MGKERITKLEENYSNIIDLKHEKDALQIENSRLKDTSKELSEKLNIQEYAIEKIEKQLKLKNAAFDEQDDKIGSCKEIERQKKKINEYKKKIERMKETLKTEMKNQGIKVQFLQSEVKSLEKRNRFLNQNLESMEKERENLQARIRSKDSTIKDLESNLNNLKSQQET